MNPLCLLPMTDDFQNPFDSEFAAARSAAVPQLSHRQFAVVAWAAFGKTNQEIGIILGLGRNTIERDLSAAIKILGAENRMGAVEAFHAWVLRSERDKSDDLSSEDS
ncbi:MAG: helix-turn-helix transcriptional regulator [Verrucomicrobiota bacterium]